MHLEPRVWLSVLVRIVVWQSSVDEPFRLDPSLLFSGLGDALGFGTDCAHIPSLIVVDDRWDLGCSGDLFMCGEPEDTSVHGQRRSD